MNVFFGELLAGTSSAAPQLDLLDATANGTSALRFLSTTVATTGGQASLESELFGTPVAAFQQSTTTFRLIVRARPEVQEIQQLEILDSSDLIREVHGSSGLTWEQISHALGVSRRTLHFWSNGGNVSASNYDLLSMFAQLVAEAPGNNPTEKRSALVLAPPRGSSRLTTWIRQVHSAAGPNSQALGAIDLLG